MSSPGNARETSLNYFTCTLGQATQLPRTQFGTVNELIDKQAEEHGNKFACGFPVPRNGDQEWGCDLFSTYSRDLRSPHLLILSAYEDLRKGSIAAAAEIVLVFENKDIDECAKCVGLLCASSVDFLFTWLGLTRAGFEVLLIA